MYMITIDGPASSGKSTVASLVAKNLNIIYVNSGQAYRAITYLLLSLNITPNEVDKIITALTENHLEIIISDNYKQKVLINRVDVTAKLHTNRISSIVAQYAKLPEVIYKASDMVLNLSSDKPIVIEGRNLGSFCFPNAEYKFYVDCEPKIRAERRYKEMIDRGEKVDFDTIYQQLLERDRLDRTRTVAPLKVPERSVLLDSSHQTPEQVADKITDIVLECEHAQNP